MKENLVFATDFAERTTQARDWTLRLARHLGLAVTIVHAVASVDAEDDPLLSRWFSKLKKEVQGRMEGEMERFSSQGIDVRGDIRIGAPWREILAAAQETDAKMIVIGGHTLQSPGVGMVGTTSQKIALAAAQPVLIVKDN